MRNTLLTAASEFAVKKPIRGSALFTTAGAAEWTCPPGVTKISVAVVAAGTVGVYNTATKIVTGGSGGDTRYKNDIAVVPGQKYAITVGQFQWGASPQAEQTRSQAFGLIACARSVNGSSTLENGVGGGNGSIGGDTGTLNAIPSHGCPGRLLGGAPAVAANQTVDLLSGIDLVTGVYGPLGLFGKSGYYVKTSDAGQGTFVPYYPPRSGCVRIMWGEGRAFPATDLTD